MMAVATEAITLQVPVTHCEACGTPTLSVDWFSLREIGNQLSVQGIRPHAGTQALPQYCFQCVWVGAGTFVCALCGETRPTNQRHRSFVGYSGGAILCTPCRETKPAREWEEAIARLERRYGEDEH